ncbi:MAG: hypothetical protein IPL01_24765 [Acidobacteria bacterium]|nr:hypothetical protein [Acidobacteriota bacterium]
MVLPRGGDYIRLAVSRSPEAMIRVINPVFFRKCIPYGDVGLGESYVEGDWDTDDIVKVLMVSDQHG